MIMNDTGHCVFPTIGIFEKLYVVEKLYVEKLYVEVKFLLLWKDSEET